MRRLIGLAAVALLTPECVGGHGQESSRTDDRSNANGVRRTCLVSL